MGKSASQKTEVTEYYLSEHFGVCWGPVDAITAITIKEKVAWSGEETNQNAIVVSQPELFGGVKKEGGVVGRAYYLPGTSDQIMPDELAVRLGRANGADCPGFRGLTSLFFTGIDKPAFYWTANNPYLPGVWATVKREPVGPPGF